MSHLPLIQVWSSSNKTKWAVEFLKERIVLHPGMLITERNWYSGDFNPVWDGSVQTFTFTNPKDVEYSSSKANTMVSYF